MENKFSGERMLQVIALTPGILKNRILQFIASGGAIRRQVLLGGFWVFGLRLANQTLTLIRVVVLARLLAPEDFGLYGIALLSMSILETFSQTGFQQALIQKKGDVTAYLDTAWTVLCLRGIALAAFLFLLAPLAAVFFGEPEVTPLLRALGIIMLCQGFTSIGTVLFQKNLEFQKQFLYQFSGTVVELAVAVTAAFFLRNTCAMICGVAVGNLVRLAVSYVLHPYRPRLKLDRDQARELFRFGRWISGSCLLGFLINEGDDLLVGKLLGTGQLGFYQLAHRISSAPTTEVTHVISQVTFPAYSRMQDSVKPLREAYLRVLQVTILISVPVSVLIYMLAPEFTQLFLGEKWLPLVSVMQVLVLAGFIRSVSSTTDPIFQGLGKPKTETGFKLLRFAILMLLLYPLTVRYGILGTSFAVLTSFAVSTAGLMLILARVIRCPVVNLLKTIILPTAAGMVMAASILLAKAFCGGGTFWNFALLILTGLFAYTAAVIVSGTMVFWKTVFTTATNR